MAREHALRKKLAPALIGVCAFIAVAFVLYEVRITVTAEAQSGKALPPSEQFTELYFDTYPTVAPARTPVQALLSFSFFIHNKEGTMTSYPFSAHLAGADGRKDALAQGTQTLTDDAKARIVVAASVPRERLARGGRVVVELPKLEQHIDFILESGFTP